MRNHQLSQNFLRSPQLALKLIGHSKIRKHDLVVEIGAGSGVITTTLAKKSREVWAIEPDPAAIAKLRANLQKYNIQNVKIFQNDFQKITMPKEDYKVFANPPFRLSATLFYKLLNLENINGKIQPKQNHLENIPTAIYLILQKQFALKLIPTDRHYTSQLGYALMQNYSTKIRLPLQKTDFTPPPAVDTVFFEAIRRESQKSTDQTPSAPYFNH